MSSAHSRPSESVLERNQPHWAKNFFVRSTVRVNLSGVIEALSQCQCQGTEREENHTSHTVRKNGRTAMDAKVETRKETSNCCSEVEEAKPLMSNRVHLQAIQLIPIDQLTSEPLWSNTATASRASRFSFSQSFQDVVPGRSTSSESWSLGFSVSRQTPDA